MEEVDMKRLARFIVLGTVVALCAAGCVLPGTGTISVRNRLSGDRQITALYIYPQGSPDTSNEISGPMDYNDTHCELGVAPGAWTIEAVIDSGAATAKENVTVVEGTLYPIWISDSDII
jgi:hypothetical protein